MIDQNKRIGLLLGNRCPPNLQAFFSNLIRMLEDEFSIDIITTEKGGGPFRDSIVYQSELPSSNNKFVNVWNTVAACRSYINSTDPDVLVQVTDPPIHGVAVGLAARRRAVTSVYRYSGDRFNEHKLERSWTRKAQVYGLNNLFGRLGPDLCDYRLALGPYTEAVLARRGYSGDNLVRLPQPVDTRTFRRTEVSALRKEILDSGSGAQTLALVVGRLTWRKGSDIILEAANRIDESGDPIQFCVVGDGPYRREFERTDCVSTPGLVPHLDIVDYYNAADVLVHPSRIEGLPNSVLEALACGTPVLGSPAGELNSLLERPVQDVVEMVNRLRSSDWESPAIRDTHSIEALRDNYVDFFEQI